MTVAELIDRLQKFPADARVIVKGYEGGYDDVDDANQIPIKLNVHTEDYYGPHEDPEYFGGNPDEIAVLIA